MTDPVQLALALVIGCLIGMGIFIAKNEVGRDACELNLPRTEKCVKVWAPEVKKQ